MNIQFSNKPFLRLLPALLMMAAIFFFSARPSDEMPLSLFERILYKAGHVIGYAMLAISFWRAFDFRNKSRWLPWLLAMLYAMTDEYHQSFVAGRHSTAFDVLIYDNIGALFCVWLASLLVKQKQPDSTGLVVDEVSVTR